MKKLTLSIYAITFFTAGFAQSPSDILGRWEGKHYVGSKPKPHEVHGGVGGPPIYDSSYQIITIEKLNGNSFTGSVYEYFISDPAGSYLKGTMSGTINGREVHFNPTVSTDNKLSKYPGMWWCMLAADAIIIKKDTEFVMQPKTGPTSCITGDAFLTKKIDAPFAPTPAIASPSGSPVVQRPATLPPPAYIPYEKTNTVTETFKKRKNNVTKTIEVSSGQLQLLFYDNGTVDGDSISVFINGQLAETHKRLSYAPFIIRLQLDNSLPYNEVAMFAENLGSIPPNTSLMVVKDGDKSFDIFLSSDNTSNAVLRIKRKSN